jgi:Ala-tRNA(Pro) deacylase
MNIYDFLEQQQIDYQQFNHPAVYTCKEAERLCPRMPGQSIKNLLLKSKDNQLFLIVAPKEKKIDLKTLVDFLNVKKLSFASSELLMKYLGVEPGAVSLLGLINDQDKKVKLVVDKKIVGKPLQCHPLVNTATLVISPEGLQKFLDKIDHKSIIVDIREKM